MLKRGNTSGRRLLAAFAVAVTAAVVSVGGGAGPIPVGSSPPVGAAGTEFTAVTPFRVLDTRKGIGAPTGPVGPGASIDVKVTGLGGVPETGVAAVVLNVTSTGATEKSFVTEWPTGEERPDASALNTEPGQDTPNLVIAKVGDGGQISLFNSNGSTHLVADITGWFATGSFFNAASPTRVLDTRKGIGAPTGPVGPGQTIDLKVLGVDPVPASGVDAVVLNLTSTEASEKAFGSVWPSQTNRPDASALNTEPGQDTPNLVISKVGTNGSISLFNSAGTTHVVGDVVGWMSTSAGFTAVSPVRALNSRTDAPLGTDSSIDVKVTGVGDVPETGVGAVVLNLTSTEATLPSFLTVSPFGEPRPDASNLNTEPGQDTPNLVIAKVVDGKVKVYNERGTTHVVGDIVGWFSDSPAITTPKDIVLGRADGSRIDRNGKDTFLPATRNDIETNRTARRLEVFSGKGPVSSGNVTGEAWLWADFPAHRPSADIDLNVRWKGSLISFAGANSVAEVTITARIIEIGGPTVATEVFLNKAVGSDQSGDTATLDDSDFKRIPVTLDTTKSYRIELELECEVRVAFSLGATTCNFLQDDNSFGAWVTSWKVTFDQGTCAAGDNRSGCIN